MTKIKIIGRFLAIGLFVLVIALLTINLVSADGPQITNNSNNAGTTGDDFIFNVTVVDNDPPSDLTVKVNWSHDGSPENITLLNTGGDYFEKTITLDDSINPMTFTIWANNKSGNMTSSGPHEFTVTDNDDPSLDVDNSPSSSTTSDPYVFDITASDNIGVGSVNVSWSHGSFSGNKALSDDGDGTWSGTIILGGSSINMVYTVQVNDTSANYVQGTEQTVSITDDDNPTSSVTAITPYWKNALNNPLTITATADDNDGLKNVTLYYYYSTDNTIFSGPYYFDIDLDPWVDVSWDFSFPDGTGYYRFYSIAVDNTSLTESPPDQNDTACGYDTQNPTSEVTDIGSYWDNTNPLTIEATGSDDISGLDYVTLYYYNSSDNSTWYGPFSYGTDTDPWVSCSWSFDFPKGTDCHYRFYSIAVDNASNFESAPVVNDTMCFWNNNPPSIPSTPSSAHTTIMVGESVGFSTSSTDDDNDKIYYGWDSNGDGTVDHWTYDCYDSGVIVTIANSWGSAGTFQIKVRARDEHGMLSVDWSSPLSISVSSGGGPGDDDDDDDYSGGNGGGNDGNINVPPVADANGPYVGLTYQNITFNASGSFDIDGILTNYTWDFGDNTTGYGVAPIHSYNSSGLFNITLIVTDNDGITDSNITTASITSLSDDDDGDEIDDETPFVDLINESDVIAIELEGKTYYLIDIDDDGEPNVLYDPISGMITTIVIRSDGTYLIDIDGDGQLDHTYKTSDTTTAEVEKEPEGFFSWVPSITKGGFLLILSIVGVTVVTILTIAVLFKIGYLYIEEESEEIKSPVNKPKSKKKN